MEKKKNILIATGIYPPSIGGPAEYTKNLEDVWKKEGHNVMVKYFNFENKLPSVVRHIYFLIKSVPSILRADLILVLDTFSVALPVAIGSMILNKKFIIRTGGDFLWESYVERTGRKVLFKNFYENEIKNLNLKEKIIFKATSWILKRADKVVFSTDWQRNIWKEPYNINISKTKIIENLYAEKEEDGVSQNTTFVGSARNIVWKNLDTLKTVFEEDKIKTLGFSLDLKHYGHKEFLDKIKLSYAVILVSLGDISPNMIMDAIRFNKPFIVTEEIGIKERIKDIAIFVDPLNINDIEEKILWLANPNNYSVQVEKIKNFSFKHSYTEIAREIMSLE